MPEVPKTIWDPSSNGKLEQSPRYLYPIKSSVPQVISYNATQITERLNHGTKVAEQFAKVGMVIAGIAGTTAPLGLLVGFYGMNVQEFTSGGSVSLFDFWQAGIPIFLATTVCFAFFLVWMMTNSARAC